MEKGDTSCSLCGNGSKDSQKKNNLMGYKYVDTVKLH
jgi:hypothetical protein